MSEPEPDRYEETLRRAGWKAQRVAGRRPKHAEPETVLWLATAVEQFVRSLQFPPGWTGLSMSLFIEHKGTGEVLGAAYDGDRVVMLASEDSTQRGD